VVGGSALEFVFGRFWVASSREVGNPARPFTVLRELWFLQCRRRSALGGAQGE